MTIPRWLSLLGASPAERTAEEHDQPSNIVQPLDEAFDGRQGVVDEQEVGLFGRV